jgi:hypothetical protein
MRRVLKPGGQVLIVDFAHAEEKGTFSGTLPPPWPRLSTRHSFAAGRDGVPVCRQRVRRHWHPSIRAGRRARVIGEESRSSPRGNRSCRHPIGGRGPRNTVRPSLDCPIPCGAAGECGWPLILKYAWWRVRH